MNDRNDMTITEFLEARIAEDETALDAMPGGENEGRGVSYCDGPAGAVYGLMTITDGRVRAECAAKRAVLAFDQDHQIWEPRGFSSDTDAEAFIRGGPKNPQARHVTRILAAVYKDHPDYQQEWALEA
jgi:hypothetical protein